MMPFRFIVFFVAALALGGCCVSSSGCYAPVPGVPTAWDGQGSRPGDGTELRRLSSTRTARPKTEVIVGPIADAPGQAKQSERPQSEKSQSEKSPSEKSSS